MKVFPASKSATPGRSITTLLAAAVLATWFLNPVAVTAAVVLSVGTYTEDFDNLATAMPDGWSVRTGATSSALGTVVPEGTASGQFNRQNPVSWGTTTGNFRNVASSVGLLSTSTVATQAASTNRALGLRQIEAFGDPGASFNFNFATPGLLVTDISFEMHMLSVQNRSTTFSIQIATGTAPTIWTTLATWSDPGVFGLTQFTFDRNDFGAALDNATASDPAWFRVVALTPSTGADNRDTVAIDNFTMIVTPEPGRAILLAAGALVLLGRRRPRPLAASMQRLPG